MQFNKAICDDYVIGDHIWLSIADILPVTEFVIKKEDNDSYYCEQIEDK